MFSQNNNSGQLSKSTIEWHERALINESQLFIICIGSANHSKQQLPYFAMQAGVKVSILNIDPAFQHTAAELSKIQINDIHIEYAPYIIRTRAGDISLSDPLINTIKDIIQRNLNLVLIDYCDPYTFMRYSPLLIELIAKNPNNFSMISAHEIFFPTTNVTDFIKTLYDLRYQTNVKTENPKSAFSKIFIEECGCLNPKERYGANERIITTFGPGFRTIEHLRLTDLFGNKFPLASEETLAQRLEARKAQNELESHLLYGPK